METTSNSVGNPLAHEFNVIVSIPQTVKIKLVDASLLSEFEIWLYLSSALLNFSTGFWVTYAQNTNAQVNKILLWISICFSLLFFFTLITVSYTHLRAHETDSYLVCRLLLEK